MNSRPLQRTVVVRNPQGLHLRPADLLVKQASRYDAEVMLGREGQMADCKSILSILTLGASQGTELHLTAEGADAAEAIASIAELFDHGFYELEGAESE
ncbi:HPr family phosphocarrier protein [Candidatus Laterigemmans baculatus]|uniref:HPr family phosphocarrier protein n=1 Tax=Candidatus Laterigemmans baculatus TaxID=2770505 RepID=UPI0013DD6FF7|nr:HPr family phosphocarrier protein [Candidatus Laterigemmans baculatus]